MTATMPLTHAKNIDLNDYGSCLVLRCPRCGGDLLHHLSVRVFDRAEDQETVIETTVDGHLMNQRAISSREAGNPSSRRDGLAIRFGCESFGDWINPGASDVIELTIGQHKGTTEIGWRYSPRKET